MVDGGAQIELDAGVDGDGVRGAYGASVSYDPNVPHRLVFGFPGTNWVANRSATSTSKAEQACPRPYPDPSGASWVGAPWRLGACPHAGQRMAWATVFTEKFLDHLEENLCIDTERVFATGIWR